MDEACEGFFNLKRIRENFYAVGKRGVKGTIEIISVDRSSGKCKALLNISIIGVTASAIINLNMLPTTDGRTSGEIVIDYEAKGFSGFVLRRFVGRFQKLADDIANWCQNGVERICKNPSKFGISTSQALQEPTQVLTMQTEPQSIRTVPSVFLDIVRRDCHYYVELRKEEENPQPPIIARPIQQFDPSKRQQILKFLDGFAEIANSALSASRGKNVKSTLRTPKEDILASFRNLGSVMFTYFLPEQINKELADICPSFLTIETNDTELPWELLFDGIDFLGLKHFVGRSVVIERGKVPKTRPLQKRKEVKILAIVDPTEDLPSARDEAHLLKKQIGELATVDLYTGRDLDIIRAMSMFASGKYDIIHYCGHAEFNENAPHKSSLVFHDGRITAFEVTKLIERNPPSIVFLNACSSAKEALVETKEVEYIGTKTEGLASAFLNAGVFGYVGALWGIFDASAAIFSSNFYGRIIKGIPLGRAMCESRREIYKRAQGKDIAWASFVLYGDPRTKLFE